MVSARLDMLANFFPNVTALDFRTAQNGDFCNGIYMMSRRLLRGQRQNLLWISEIMSFLRKKFHQDHIFKGISNLIFAHE